MQYANVIFYGDNIDKIIQDKIYKNSTKYTYINLYNYNIKKDDVVLVKVNTCEFFCS